jgi:hypothetical protein
MERTTVTRKFNLATHFHVSPKLLQNVTTSENVDLLVPNVTKQKSHFSAALFMSLFIDFFQ